MESQGFLPAIFKHFNDTGLLKQMEEHVSFKFAHLADSNSAELSKMELTNATTLGDWFFSFIFNEYKMDPKSFLQKTNLEICQKTQGH